MAPTVSYTTILSTNYLPKALALAESLRRHHDAELEILFVDIPDEAALPELSGARCRSTASLGISRREVQRLAAAYELVELATAVKPLLLGALLQQADQVFYLDPDTYVTSPMEELSPALAATDGGILLTPHFLRPPSRAAETTEGHMLFAGVYNLGFCGVDCRTEEFLDWWWEHLRSECLYDPLSGLFYDQKWMDIGIMFFEGGSLRHYGYNVSLANLPERPVARDDDGYYVASNGDRLRLFHFHAFDSSAPEKLSARLRDTGASRMEEGSALLELCKEYAEVLSGYEQALPPAPPYPYTTDTKGRPLHRKVRRAYRTQMADGADLPSPFDPADGAAWDRWRRKAWRPVARGLVGDAAKCVRIVVPEEYDKVKKRFPRLADRLNDRFSGGTGLWG